MSSNELGEHFRILTFGESHGPAMGVVIDGVVPGMSLSIEDIQVELDRRRPGTSPFVTSRQELDRAEILSGIFNGVTTGAPICIVVRNHDARPADYDALADIVRPGHGVGWLHRYGVRDWRGGGRTSGRETVGRVAAGAVAKAFLASKGVVVQARVQQVANIKAGAPNWDLVESDPIRCGDLEASNRMQAAILAAKSDGDSLGGIVEVFAYGVPAGLGDPVFCKLDAELAKALVSIGAVKGVEFGDGFLVATKTGSENNDRPTPKGFASNHCGGILGGISTGQTLIMRLAVKPTPTIGQDQETVDLKGNPVTLHSGGRHDPCICPRLVPVAEAMVALVLADAWMRRDTSLNS
ncbi:MAG TPA: chorismate synthase [Myxococcota bacterium]|nr:chorismate synthase [Myxococcota bacterium]HON24789.1 chorismate synthase [Myxococcota bacterium]HOS61164.1 chorismate synthase [Myxococcota bacterium]HPC91087.1 chorismate synthase [Myxococcota bacterium]HPL24550.1 chorismate synthase [Myxococcota bacterium]